MSTLDWLALYITDSSIISMSLLKWMSVYHCHCQDGYYMAKLI